MGWLKLYDDQINNYQKEIYDLHLKLYFSQHPQTTTAIVSPASLPQQHHPQPHHPQPHHLQQHHSHHSQQHHLQQHQHNRNLKV